ncbi:DUF2889 domain-containing protein [bacterium]|nr:DUF2889 domain-containing protein [bacterium]
MAIKGLENLAKRGSFDLEEIYERNINVSVSRFGDDLMRTKASLLDLNHNMRVDLVVRVTDRTIMEARSQMVKTPFAVCEITGNRIKTIVGMKIERGVTKKMRELLSGPSGCTHLYELAVEAVRMSSNVMMGFATGDEKEWRERRMSDEEFINRAQDFLKNSCLPFSGGNGSEPGKQE